MFDIFLPFIDKQHQVSLDQEIIYFRNEVKSLEDSVRTAREQAKAARDQAKEITGFDFSNNQVDEAITEKFNSLPDNMTELDNAIDILRLRCEGIANIDDSVLVEYQRYQQQIGEKTNECRELECELARNENEIQTIKPLWLDALNTLIGQINQNFSQFMAELDYSGEVYLFHGNKEVSLAFIINLI